MSTDYPKPEAPARSYQRASAATLGLIGTLCKIFTFGFSKPEAHGLDEFLQLLDTRRDPARRTRGLITVSNHLSIIDDPLIWAFLPYKYMLDTSNMRWSLGSYDLCYLNKTLGQFFFYGQVLPTHRLKHSPLGGPFQPTMRQAIRLLSDAPLPQAGHFATNDTQHLSSPLVPDADPFSSAALTYSTTGDDSWPSPSSYMSNRYSWVHVFPEGRVHQHPHKTMRYFRWGIARMILEADECPDVIPMWIEGYAQVYPEDRVYLRPLPRIRKKLEIWFGENVAGAATDSVSENVFHALRLRWRSLVHKETVAKGLPLPDIGTLPESLQHGKEAVELRIECTHAVRDAVLELRRRRGLSDEDPKAGLVDTWREEGDAIEGSGEKGKDGSMVGNT